MGTSKPVHPKPAGIRVNESSMSEPQFDLSIDENVIVVRGVLVETLDWSNLQVKLEKVCQQVQGSRLAIDISGVTRCNSIGLNKFLSCLEQRDAPKALVGVPFILLPQLSVILGSLGGNAMVESLCLPFYCVELDEVRDFVLRVGMDFPLSDALEEYTFPPQTFNGQSYIPDFDAGIVADCLLQNLTDTQ